ncbi:MAG: NTP transferase domain-containing protein [Verrucomicrobia bacterium]|nr:NTP transferase domain-containing protein [Verrucomicrobiota bacterium]
MKIFLPMAGRGSRFADQGIMTPKPLVEVSGRPMIAFALEGLCKIDCSEIIFVALKRHYYKYHLDDLMQLYPYHQFKFVLLEKTTDGQLCSILAAREHIKHGEDILIGASDTYVVSNIGKDIARRRIDCEGIISVAEMPGDNWSFARIGKDGGVTEVAEKRRISHLASTGLYYFSNGRRFLELADEMIRNREKTRGEYYVIPIFQKYIDRGWRIDISMAREVWDMGTPQAKEDFERHLASGAHRKMD